MASLQQKYNRLRKNYKYLRENYVGYFLELRAIYQAAVRAICDDSFVDPAPLVRLIVGLDAQHDEVKRDVDRYKRRKELAAKAANIGAIRAELAVNRARQAEASGSPTLAQAIDVSTDNNKEQLTVESLEARLREAVAAAELLVRECDDATIKLDSLDLNNEERDLMAEQSAIEAEIDARVSGWRGIDEMAGHIAGRFRKLMARVAAVHEALPGTDGELLAALKSRLAGILKRRAEIEVERAKLEARKLLP
jgi:hypothetical protein